MEIAGKPQEPRQLIGTFCIKSWGGRKSLTAEIWKFNTLAIVLSEVSKTWEDTCLSSTHDILCSISPWMLRDCPSVLAQQKITARARVRIGDCSYLLCCFLQHWSSGLLCIVVWRVGFLPPEISKLNSWRTVPLTSSKLMHTFHFKSYSLHLYTCNLC